MPCDSSHMNPTPKEVQISRMHCFLAELEGKTWKKKEYEGYHSKVYNQGLLEGVADILADQLCTRLKRKTAEEISQYSLELQLWWRDHQKADVDRIKKTKKAYNSQLIALLQTQDCLQIEINQLRARMKLLEIE